MKKSWNYGRVRIGLLNFTADEDMKSFSGLPFAEKEVQNI